MFELFWSLSILLSYSNVIVPRPLFFSDAWKCHWIRRPRLGSAIYWLTHLEQDTKLFSPPDFLIFTVEILVNLLKLTFWFMILPFRKAHSSSISMSFPKRQYHKPKCYEEMSIFYLWYCTRNFKTRIIRNEFLNLWFLQTKYLTAFLRLCSMWFWLS